MLAEQTERKVRLTEDGQPQLRCFVCPSPMIVAPWSPPTWLCPRCKSEESMTLEQVKEVRGLQQESRPQPEHRTKVLRLTAEQIANVLSGEWRLAPLLPVEARVAGVVYHPTSWVTDLIIESPRFAPVAEGLPQPVEWAHLERCFTSGVE